MRLRLVRPAGVRTPRATRGALRGARALVVALVAAAVAACGGPMNPDASTGDGSRADAPRSTDVTPLDTGTPPGDGGPVGGPVTDQVDLLLLVDNSNSMETNQAQIMSQLGTLISGLTNPPCTSPTNTAPHPCNAADPMDRQIFPAVRDLHVGVISSDLGTGGMAIPSCANPTSGDDGRLNPIRYGAALATHRPFSAPAGFRPADCTNPDQFPAFIRFESGTTSPMAFEHDFRCNAGLYVGGCGLEQQLEAVHRALITHDARERAGNTSPNAGFVRDGALLAIVLLTDEEDMSVRDDARAVFDQNSSAWASPNLNLRAYLYRAGSAQDPTYPLDRYVDPRNPAAGWLALKPGHPERVIFAAITGIPMRFTTTDAGATQWDQLLGPPGGNPDDFNARNAMGAVQEMSREGLVSMRAPNPDPRCSDRVVPACRREGSLDDPMNPACTQMEQYFAWPARRIVEVARRFDESRLCNGQPCRNGLVCSICASNFGPCVLNLARRIGRRVLPPG